MAIFGSDYESIMVQDFEFILDLTIGIALVGIADIVSIDLTTSLHILILSSALAVALAYTRSPDDHLSQ